MAHVAAHHMHVNVSGVVTGPGTVLAAFFDNVDSITFTTGGVIEIQHQSHLHEIDFHAVNNINVVLNPDSVIFNISGSA